MAGTGEGWRDPRLRLLRTLAFLVLAGLLVFAVAAERDVTTTGLLTGALMVLLGFEGILRWPPGGGSTP